MSSLRAQVAGSLPRIDKFRATSEFGRLEASGDEEKLTVDGTLDLGLFGRKVGQFVDLGGTQPAGRADRHSHHRTRIQEPLHASRNRSGRGFGVDAQRRHDSRAESGDSI